MKSTPLEVDSPVRLRVKVRGVVQGVGFRPFVYRLTRKFRLNGWVRNTSGNVTIEVEGQEAEINRFLTSLKQEAPPVAHIRDITTEALPVEGGIGFSILESRAKAGEYQPISGDIATCSECLKEIFGKPFK